MVAAILARAPMARLLATSREPLAVAGEHLLPLVRWPWRLTVAGQAEALQLLVERTTAMRPDFDPTPVQPALAAICAQLDGMPLAIELAVARLRTLSPAAVADRLHQRFRLLTGGHRTASERHKTLRATVDWSYDLLDDAQRRLFDCLAVFAGAFSLDDVAAVGADRRSDRHDADLDPDVDDDGVVDLLAELVDRSLVTVTNAEPSYRLLETLRAYGIERLGARGELDSVRRRHARWFAAKATQTRADACGPADHAVWQLAMAQVSDYQSAAAWALDHGEIDLAVGIPTDLTEAFWLRYAIDVTAWAAPLVGQITLASPATQARVLWNVGCYQQVMLGDLVASGQTVEAALRLDPTNAFCGLQASMQGVLTGDLDAMCVHAGEALALAGDDPAAAAGAYVLLSSGAYLTGHHEDARRYAAEFLARARAWAWPGAIGHALYGLARIDVSTSPQQARHRLDEAHRIARQIESYSLTNITQMELVSLMIDDGDDRRRRRRRSTSSDALAGSSRWCS